MKRTTITLAALLAALVPAASGCGAMPPSPRRSRPGPGQRPGRHPDRCRRPGATTGEADDHGGDTPRDQRTEPGDDRDDRSATSTSTPSGTRTTEAGDDHGGDTPRDQRTEPGDDRDSRLRRLGLGRLRIVGSGSDQSGSRPASGSGSGLGVGRQRSGSSGSGRSGSDDSGSDDHGGHGSDD